MAREDFSVPRWVIALAVALPVAVGTYFVLRKQTQRPTASDQNGTCKKSKTPVTSKSDESATGGKAVDETPLGRAIQLKNSGNTFFKKGEYDDAIRCYTEAVSVCPSEEKEQMSMFYQNRAAAYEALHDLERALKDCSTALSLKPDYLKALTRRYKVAEKLGKMQQALEDVTAVCILEKFNNMDSLQSADRILKAIGSAEGQKFMKTRKPVLPSDYFMKSYFSSYTHDPVIKNLSSLASAEPVLLSGVEKARKALYEGRYTEIEKFCDEELARPTSVEAKEKALLLRASMKILTSQTPEAMSDLNLLIASSKDTKIKANALLKRACLHMQMEDSEKSFQDFSLAADIDPNNPDVPHQKAQMFLLGERLEDAVNEFNKASTLNPDSGLIQVQKLYSEYRLANSREDAKLSEKSKIGLQRAIKKYPNTPEGYMLLAQVYNDAKDFEKAESIFDDGIKSDPFNASILVHKGLLYLQWKEDITKAIELIEKAIEVDSKCEFAYETLASIEVQRGNLERAVQLFDKAIPLAKSEREASHILSLQAAAQAQIIVSQTLGLETQ